MTGTAVSQVDLQLGTRPQRKGGAFVAVANDANAAYWNPAGLSQITRGEVTSMRWMMAEVSQIKVDYAAAKYVGTNLKNENLIPYYTLGSAYQYVTKDTMDHFLVAVDASTRQDIDGKDGLTVKIAGGLEYQLLWRNFLFAARGGIGTRNYTAGVSLGYRFVCLDYAFVAMNEETTGDSHKFGVSLHF